MLTLSHGNVICSYYSAKTNSQALLEVWMWKDCAYQEVASLPIDRALKKRLDDSMRSVRELGFPVSAKLIKKEAYARLVACNEPNYS